jgi:hypothetical protein
VALASQVAWAADAGAQPAAHHPQPAAHGAATAPCADAVAWNAAAVPAYRHIFVIADVGHDYDAIHHNTFAPVINRLAATHGLASQYFTTSDPDIANIVAMLAGSSFRVDKAPVLGPQAGTPFSAACSPSGRTTPGPSAPSMARTAGGP